MEDSYKKVSARIDAEWYPYHEMEWFTQVEICQFFDWKEPSTRKAVSYKLYYESSLQIKPRLEKKNKGYRIIDRSIEEIDWLNADPENVYHLKFPYGLQDKTYFAFEGDVCIPPKGIILVAGVSNEGKTAFIMNVIVDNMDDYKILYFTNELTEIGLKRRFKYFMDWCDLVNGDGQPKFKTILRYDNYQDVVDPDAVNCIDYLDVNAEGEYYKLVPYIKGIQKKLNKGIAIIALQKPPGRQDAFGGANLRGAASLYLSIDKGRLEVLKAKDWTGTNPNGKKYTFDITYNGSQFENIHEVVEE